MKAVHWIIAAAALSSVQPSQAAFGDPEVIIYRFPGVKDDGLADFTGVATVFHCTNFSGVTELIRYVTRNFDGTLKSNVTHSIGHLNSLGASTKSNFAYGTDVFLTTGLVSGGTTAIAATSTSIVCTATTVDAANSRPTGVSLRGVRFNPAPGTQE